MIEFVGDLHIKGSSLWLDARRKRKLSFVSHAHSDHIRRHERIIASPETVALARYRLKELPARKLAFNRPTRIENLTLELLPAGHILGSAQACVERDGQTLIYTGDFKLRRSPACRPMQIRRADILVMECTYGNPAYVFPPEQEVVGELCQFLDECLETGLTPVLIVYAMGKAQEVMKLLGERGYLLAVHESIWEIARVYRRFGHRFPGAKRLSFGKLEDKVVLVPTGRMGSSAVGSIRRKRTAFLSGWAAGKGAKYRFGTDRAFALSDHADFPELLALTELVRPRKVLTVHGPEGFARTLRGAGFDAQALKPGTQLALF